MNIRDRVKLALYTEKLMDFVSNKQQSKTKRPETEAAAKKDTLTISKEAEEAQKKRTICKIANEWRTAFNLFSL